MEEAGSSDMLVSAYHTTSYLNAEDSDLNLALFARFTTQWVNIWHFPYFFMFDFVTWCLNIQEDFKIHST